MFLSPQCWRWPLGFACFFAPFLGSNRARAAEPERAAVSSASAPASVSSEPESPAPSNAVASEAAPSNAIASEAAPSNAVASEAAPSNAASAKVREQPSRGRPPTAWYVCEFVTGVSFATMQVALVWAIVDHDEPTKRDRALLVSGVAAVTALAGLGAAALVLASDNAKQPRATAYLGLGSVGLRASF